MPPRVGSSKAAAPEDPAIEVTISSAQTELALLDDGDTFMAAETAETDAPGPSTTFIPRAPTPPLPDLSRNYADEEEEDDEVIHTLPIYLSPALFPNLAVFQYPLQHRSLRAPTWAADRGKKITTRVKETVGRVEIEVPVDAGADVWREEKAKDLGFVTDVQANGDVEGGVGRRKKSEQKWGDKMRLRSEAVPNASGVQYYSGVISDGALHLHPITRTLQFRTALNYLDDRGPNGEERAAEKKAAPMARPAVGRIYDDPDNDGSGSIKDFRNKMWLTAQKEDSDPWVPYTWKDDQLDDKVTAALDSLLVHEDKRDMLECRTRGLDFLDKDVPAK
ncbi:hypothetical protein Q5752_002085 [Cryptotrichosporon argae]